MKKINVVKFTFGDWKLQIRRIEDVKTGIVVDEVNDRFWLQLRNIFIDFPETIGLTLSNRQFRFIM
ncbi:MAG: hypothetical protein ACFFCI_02315 [Promethearchaeota archaeon]